MSELSFMELDGQDAGFLPGRELMQCPAPAPAPAGGSITIFSGSAVLVSNANANGPFIFNQLGDIDAPFIGFE